MKSLTKTCVPVCSEYWERLVLCNAMVWTCELTGRPSLTYQEAIDSEAKGLKFLSSLSQVFTCGVAFIFGYVMMLIH